QAEDGIRDRNVTGVQTCALPICGACAGPLVAGAAILSDSPARRITGLRDSKLMTAATRERAHDEIVAKAVAWSVVVVPHHECDRLGMHVANLAALRRALVRLEVTPSYVLTDGFGVDGLRVPGLAVWEGGPVAACVAAASVLAKVTRDRLMAAADETYPGYGFAVHKGYCTPEHQEKLDQLGPCEIHRWRFENVRRAARSQQQRRKSTRLNSSHVSISYAVFCLKKKTMPETTAAGRVSTSLVKE